MSLNRKLATRLLVYGIAIGFALLSAFPFFWMVITAFKANRDLYNPTNNPFLFNEPPTLDHIRLLFFNTPYVRWLGNTSLVGIIVVLITVVLAVPAGYSLARLIGRWGERLAIMIFLAYLIPPTLLFIPLSRVISLLGLQDSLWSLVLVYPSFAVPFCTWLMMGFFKSIPLELEDAALVDGCSRLGALVRIIFPISISGILTTVIFAFTLSTQEFVYALTFISSSAHKTISVGVPTDLIRGDVFYWGSLMAAALLPSVFIALIYNAFLDRFIAGITGGALK